MSREPEAVKGQANKGTGRMPWHQEPKKDVTNCDKLRGTVNRYRSVDFRMGEPTWAIPKYCAVNKIAVWGNTR